MPTYDYKCSACGHLFEHFQSIHDARLKKCPKCGKSKLERLIGAGGGLLFKGSGFYITDYRDRSYHDAAKKDAAPAAPAAAADGKSGASSASESKSKSKGGDAPAAKESAPKPAAKPDVSGPAARGGASKKGR
jgi:putative FmdB family regulatory protein